MNWQQSQRNVPHLLPASAIRIGIGPVAAGETILDIGCGAGMDLLLAAKRTGSRAGPSAIDMTPAMIEHAKCTALKTGVWQNVEIRRGTA